MMDRRRLLRGTLAGGIVTVGLPLLDIFLDSKGQAMAGTGKPIPVRFGTWFWGLGMNEKEFVPDKVGAGFDLKSELAPLAEVKDKINVFTGYNVFNDDSPALCHWTGWITLRSGSCPASRTDTPGETIDVTIARKIGGGTRFRSLDSTATGNARDASSYFGQNAYNTPEISPASLYERVFGPEFNDPNGATFTPNPKTMMRQSVLSGVLDDAKDLHASLGVEDRARLDQYFTGLREVEHQLDHQLEKPDPIPGFRAPQRPKDVPIGLDYELVARRHKLMTDLMVLAVQSDQTRVFNMVYSAPTAATAKPGEQQVHHTATHEELIEAGLGYQPLSHWFLLEAMKNWAYFVKTLGSVKEGDGTLLDHSLVYAHSDTSLAKVHSLETIPMFTAGTAGGRIKTGMHITGEKQPGTRLGYTLQKAFGVDADKWGTKSNATNKPISEIMA
jgi:Protein of unknown function (DUF1552)